MNLFTKKFIRSQQLQISAKIKSEEKLSKSEEEYKELFAEYEKSLSMLKDESFKRELVELELEEAKRINEQYKSNIDILSKHTEHIKITDDEVTGIIVSTPFNICVLGEVSDEALIRKKLNNYFQKIGVDTIAWSIDFHNNSKLQNSNILRSLQKGQSKYSLIVTGQIFHHSGRGNEKANIIAELNNEKYIPHIIGGSPKDLLTPEGFIEVFHKYLVDKK